MTMTRDELLDELRRLVLVDKYDGETSHSEADEVLLRFIADPEVSDLYGQLTHWCA